MTGAITAILSIISLLVEAWLAASPQRAQESVNDDKMQLRAAIAGGDVIALGNAIDSVSSASGDPSGQPTDQDIARGLAEITGS